jgi:hypothetical protein
MHDSTDPKLKYRLRQSGTAEKPIIPPAQGETVQGWTSIAIFLLAFGSVQMLCLGIMGEYPGRMYGQTNSGTFRHRDHPRQRPKLAGKREPAEQNITLRFQLSKRGLLT